MPIKPKKTLQDQFNDVLEIADSTLESFDKPSSSVAMVIVEPKNEIMLAAGPDFKKDFAEDYNTTRTTLQNMITRGTWALESILELAQEGESARNYEVVGQLIKITSDVAKDLLALQKTVIDIQKVQLASDEGVSKPGGATTNNIEQAIIFSGTTEDALRKIKQLGNKQE